MFYKNKNCPDNYASMCKTCVSMYYRERREDPIIGEKTRERKRTLAKEKYKNNPDYKAKVIESNKKYSKNNPEKNRIRVNRFRKNNIEKCRSRERELYQERKNNAVYKLNRAMKGSIWQALRHKKVSKNGANWESLVGYKKQDLIDHLESQFEDGMSWDNYGKWHIDHIVPKSLFEYETPYEVGFKICWGLNNLQPLWAQENMAKSNKLIL